MYGGTAQLVHMLTTMVCPMVKEDSQINFMDNVTKGERIPVTWPLTASIVLQAKYLLSQSSFVWLCQNYILTNRFIGRCQFDAGPKVLWSAQLLFC